MKTFKQYTFPFIFLLTVFIASCFTFNRNGYLSEYDFNYEMTADDINLFDSLTLYNTKSNVRKQQKLLLLFKNDSLRTIISNDLWRSRSYKYQLVENKIHLLSSKMKSQFDRGGDMSWVDSVAAIKNIIISKQKSLSNRRASWNKELITIYIKQPKSIFQYELNDSLYNSRNYEYEIKTLLYLVDQNKISLGNSNEFKLKQVLSNSLENEQAFFRKYIMKFPYTKK